MMEVCVFRFKIAVLLATCLLISLFPADAQPAPSGSPRLEFPAWLASPAGARDEQTHTGADEIDSSYRVAQST